jgi:iron complex outermembrane receptor protein
MQSFAAIARRAPRAGARARPFHPGSPAARIALYALLICVVPAHAEPGDLGEVVVTSTLRPETVLNAPASVTVLSADALHGAGQQHLEDVLALVPNLNWAGDTARPRYFQIRGIGELAQYQGAPNPSIGFLIDDIDFSGLGTAATLFDIDRVEVLRGPQGARYGANALGGLVYVTSAAPTPQFEGRVEAGVGNYGSRSYGAVLSGPLAGLDSEARLSVQRFTSDGYYSNAYLHRADTAGFDELTVRGRWRVQPSARLVLDLTLLHVQLDNGYDDFAVDNSRTTRSDQPGVDSQHSTGAAARLVYSIADNLQLTAIGSYADSPIKYSFDGDWGSPPSWAPYIYESSEVQERRRSTRNLEVRLAGQPSAQRSWIVGVYALDLRESLDDTISNLYQDPTSGYFPPPVTAQTTSAFASRSTAVFASFDRELGSALHVQGGARTERRAVDYHDTLAQSGAAPSVRAFAPGDSLWGGDVSLTWKPAANESVYLLASRGYKDGGFNLSPGLPTSELQFSPETDLNLELGFKADIDALRLHVDNAVFYTRRRALQLLTGTQLQPDDPSTFVFYTGNAPAGFNAGLESSLQWQPLSRLDLGATLGLLTTRYRGLVQNGVALPDRALPHAPSWQASLHATWQDPRGPFARIDVSGVGSFYFDLPPNPTASHSYSLVAARAGVERGRWRAACWGRNLFNRSYAVRGFYFGDEPPNFPNKEYLQLGAPRTFGIDATVRF